VAGLARRLREKRTLPVYLRSHLPSTFDPMPSDQTPALTLDWRTELPPLSGTLVALREPVASDRAALVDLLSLADATRFRLQGPLTESAVQHLIERAIGDRRAGSGFTYAIGIGTAGPAVGLLQVRQLDPLFDAAEWECTLAPSARGTGAFLEAARLAGSFAFASVGAHRLEARVPLQHGRANSALRKLGAVQEAILRRSLQRDGEYLDQILWSILKEDWGELSVPAAARVH
jgi:RimJ/RimL family protein N-acetyltransferase